jgi:transcriptional regulator with GAF, ATPase, and Fis domain
MIVPSSDPYSAGAQVRLVAISGPLSGEVVPLNHSLVGRSAAMRRVYEVVAVQRSRFHDAVRQAKIDVIVVAFREAHHSYSEAARLLGLHPNYLHRLIRTLDMKSILEPDR